MLARWTGVVQDDAGNAVAGASIEVRDEATGALVMLYSNRAGTVSLGNPFVSSDGTFGFHVLGGSYRITATRGAFERTWRFVPIGTLQERDIGALDAKLDKAAARHWFLSNSPETVPAGTTRFLGANRAQAAAAQVYVPVPRAGTFRKMQVVTTGSPGPVGSTAKWTCTLQNLFSDTAMTGVINPGVNSVVSEVPVSFTANARFCVKVVADPANTGTGGSMLVALEFEPDA